MKKNERKTNSEQLKLIPKIQEYIQYMLEVSIALK